MFYAVDNATMKKAEELCERDFRSKAMLMDNAGCAIGKGTCKYRKVLPCHKVVIISGNGNNGGDGFALAKYFHDHEIKSTVVLTGDIPSVYPAKECFDKNKDYFDKLYFLSSDLDKIYDAVNEADFIFDCVYGTGFHGKLKEEIKNLFSICNKTRAYRVSADVASGCDLTYLTADEGSFVADLTIALGAVKLGQLSADIVKFCGDILPMDIDIPIDCYPNDSIRINDDELLRLFPRRTRSCHKGDFGKLLIIAGNEQCLGAPWLCTHAALRMGTGLVTLCSTKDVIRAASVSLHQCVYLPVGDEPHISYEYMEKILKAAKESDAVVIGCGMGDYEDTWLITREIIKNTNCPVLIDGDGINSVVAHIDEIKDNSGRLILTPHPKEFSRISGLSVEVILKNKITVAKNFARKYGVTLLLKDAYSVCASHKGEVTVTIAGNAGLAKGGSGDTLSGTIGALLAQGLSPINSIRLGSHIFGLAAEKMAREGGICSVMPAEIPFEYPSILGV